jgi:hypothetical protein
LKLQDKTDRALFFASSVMRVGDGRNTPFWESLWLNGVSPKELAPNLFNQARFKQRTVHKELQQFNWITNIQSIGTEDLLDEFILLFTLLSEVQLSEEKDTIIWKWTVTGEYSTSSTHEVQFLGAYPLFRASTIWQAKTEDKYRFFAWLAVQGKAPTADNLTKKNWSCNAQCSLCYCINETNEHLLTECNFAEAVWDRVAHDLLVHPMIALFHKGDISDWIERATRTGSRKQQRLSAGVIFLWQI